jgi:neutral ceramidase
MKSELKIGAAKREITPAIGADLSGFIARLKPSNAVADPLYVRALVAASDEKAVAIVQADLLGFDTWHVAQVREFARRHLGIATDAVLLSATHTHSGPGLVPVRGCRMAPYTYQWEVIQKIEDALQEAGSRLSLATIEIGSIPYTMGINRRQETSDGVILGFAPEKPRPKSLEVARIQTADQEILLFSHACHPYVLGGDSLLISGDFTSLACAELEKDARVIAFFLNGCAGNIAPRSAFQGLERAREEGHRLAATVREACGQMWQVQQVHLSACTSLIHLPYLPLPTKEEIAALAQQEERVVRPEEKENPQIRKRIAHALEEWQITMKQIVQMQRPLDPVQCEVQVIRLGPLVLVGISGEPFFEIGEQIRATSPFPATWPLGYANAYCGYIPTHEEYLRGGYEVDDAWKYVGVWKLDETCERRVIKAATTVLNQIC